MTVFQSFLDRADFAQLRQCFREKPNIITPAIIHPQTTADPVLPE
jgi:hypothetical protein